MNLVLSKEQRYISKVDHIKFQAWQVEDIDQLGNAFITTLDKQNLPTTRNYNLYVQDVLNNTEGNYSEFRLKTSVIYDSVFKDWLSIPLTSLNRVISSNNLVIPFSIAPSFLTIIEGYHNARIVFKIVGIQNGLEIDITSFTFNYSLKVFPQGNYYTPLAVEIVTGKDLKKKTPFIVDGNNYEVIAPPGISIIHLGLKYSNFKSSGYKVLDLEITSDKDSEFSKTLIVKYTNTTYNILVSSLIFEDYTPKVMLFNASAGLIDNPIQRLYFAESGDYTLSYPYWLQVKKINTSPRYLEVYLPSTNNFGTGEFKNSISLKFTNKTVEVPVILNVFDGFNLGIRNGEILFAESTPLLQFTTSNSSSHLEVDFILDDEDRNLFNFNYKVPFFLRKAEFSIAEILRRQIILKDYYQPNFSKKELPILSLSIKEIQGETILKEYSKTNIQVLNGSKPSRILDNMAILNMDILERFTPLGTAVVNVLSPGMFSYSITVNSKLVYKVEQTTGVIRSINIAFSKLGVTEGDMVEFVLHTSKGDLTKTFVITQLTPHSNVFFYRNKHGLTSSIELTGELKIDVEKKRKLEKFTANGDFKVRSYLEDSQEKITINTGYIFLDQIALVNELLESNEAFFYQGDDRFMVVPSSEKMNKIDTSTFLNSIQLEFIINDIHYAQIHF
ncbi:hypothetical protein [Myroides odoratimimus]|uniref:Uncharacterized protein n=1 Tax=Myroides odoratimimus CIP 101113 TaxID=883154 RepID=A0AAV3F5A0_9FLAO|nr:hypothetical protein [Myroides odoratimimus]EHO13807.1 hypothetical protein HMPREF9715_00881 [Myroides odoratimimus CIP 101113]